MKIAMQSLIIASCITCSSTSSYSSQPLAIATTTSRAIASAATVGYILGRIASGKTPSGIAGSFGAVAGGTVGACTVAPYFAYKQGGSQGLLTYATFLAVAILWRETSH